MTPAPSTDDVKVEALNAFLIRFADAGRGLRDPNAVAQTACQLIAEGLGVERAYWSEVDWLRREFIVGADHHRPGATPVAGRFPWTPGDPSAATILKSDP